mmetsp:Transcript_32391/g.31685  ORF Transcript_32391/g.31685 Transcript_32391/m.31685 type:complete len:92 (+) Transcript_32391:907-1182(+)
MTFQQLFDYMKDKFNVEVSLVSCGQVALFNLYLPGGKHEPRKVREVSEVYKEIATDHPLPTGRKYLALEIAGEVIGEGADCSMPTVKYFFA